jgi:hypothetical protein
LDLDPNGGTQLPLVFLGKSLLGLEEVFHAMFGDFVSQETENNVRLRLSLLF